MTGGVALSVRAGEGTRARPRAGRAVGPRATGPGKQASEGDRGRAGRPRCWAELREKRSRPELSFFCFYFSKNVNSIQFYLFCFKLFRIPKIVKIFV
jgi:hypothetical protein